MSITEKELLGKELDYHTANEIYQWFQDYSWDDSKPKETLPLHLILVYGEYACGNYEGDAFVVGYNTESKQWFTVSGGHCSCYGLEGQWDEDYSDFAGLLVYIQTLLNQRYSCDSSSNERLAELFQMERTV